MGTRSLVATTFVIAASMLAVHCSVHEEGLAPSSNVPDNDGSTPPARADSAAGGGDSAAPSPSSCASTCDGKCVDTNSDVSNCGACGRACAPGLSCSEGDCVDARWAEWRMPNPVAASLPNPASYTANADTVIDNVTHLEWQRAVPLDTYTWADAQTYCNGLALGGKSGWRLPTRIELVSLFDFTRTTPAIDQRAFPSTPSGQYDLFWSSSPLASDASKAWCTDFRGGGAGATSVNFAGRVRCVR